MFDQAFELGPVPDLENDKPLPCCCPVVNFCKPVTVHLAGLALNCDNSSNTFTLDIDASVSSYENAKDHANGPLRPVAPIQCVFPQSSKYSESMPRNGSFVSVRGVLTDVTFINNNRHDGVERFHVTIDAIGQSAPCASSADAYSESLAATCSIVYN